MRLPCRRHPVHTRRRVLAGSPIGLAHPHLVDVVRQRRQGQLRLESGDRLTRREFERRLAAHQHIDKAELIEGVVHMPSPVRLAGHGEPHAWILFWLTTYSAHTPGVRVAGNASIRLDSSNEPQPDALLRIEPRRAGTPG